MTNVSGGVCESMDYLPFGENNGTSGTCSTSHKFTGKERDSESGLDNFGARYDSSQYGRFMTPDWSAKPISVPYADFSDPQTLNLYSYTRNNPLNHTDSDGHCVGPLLIYCVVAAVAFLGGAAIWHLHEANKADDAGLKNSANGRRDAEESREAAARGEPADDKAEAARKDTNAAINDARDAFKAVVQIPGTSTGGPLPASLPDAAAHIVREVVVEKIIDSATPAPNVQQKKAPPTCVPGTEMEKKEVCK
jgi:RHS repeat-associated protein